MKNFSDFLGCLKKELVKGLPGEEFQKRMMSALRNELGSITYRHPKKAGVLLLLYPFEDQIFTSFIKRTQSDYPHSGQISFPGGKCENSDESVIHTAIRETHEELGVVSEDIRILGSLTSLFIPVSNFNVFPSVGYVLSRPVFNPNPAEVQEIIEVSIDKFFNPNYISGFNLHVGNRVFAVPCYRVNNNKIWGATAMIMSEFEALVS
jgi:8-oxo-dGTP pyrophosphatase MutT (NUDIX family)